SQSARKRDRRRKSGTTRRTPPADRRARRERQDPASPVGSREGRAVESQAVAGGDRRPANRSRPGTDAGPANGPQRRLPAGLRSGNAAENGRNETRRTRKDVRG